MDLAALKAKLDAMDGQALQDAERKALRAVGNLMRDAIQSAAPARTEYDGGDLQPGALKTGFHASVHIASDAATTIGDTSRVTIAPNSDVAHVARFVENGHANRPGSKNANTPAHPFIRPASDATQQAAIDLYTATITEAISKAFTHG